MISTVLICGGLTATVEGNTHFLRALMNGGQANQGNGTGSPGTGVAYVWYDDSSNEVWWEVSWEGLEGTPTAMHFHGPATAGENAGVIQGIGVDNNPAIGSASITAAQGDDLLAGLWYVNLHTSTESGGEIRGQVLPATFQDDFSDDLSRWGESTRGLENNAAAGYDAPDATGEELTLAGTTNFQYWFGNSLESVMEFDSRLSTEVRVTRVSLSGSGTAWRSSLWILGDDGHYLHYSQNVGENGWQYNARDDGGSGTLGPTGGGNNIASLDGLDNDGGTFEMAIRMKPRRRGEAGSIGIGPVAATNLDSAGTRLNITDGATVVLGAGTYDVTSFKFTTGGTAGDLQPFLAVETAANTYEVIWVGPTSAEGTGTNGSASHTYPAGSEKFTLDADTVVYAGFNADGPVVAFVQPGNTDHNNPANFGITPGASIGPFTNNDLGRDYAFSIDVEPGSEVSNVIPGAVDVTMLHDGVEVASHSFSNFPTQFRVVLTGQARAGGDTVTAVFDDLAVFQETVDNRGPAFNSNTIAVGDGQVGRSYSGTLVGSAVDPEGEPLTYSKLAGPAWLQVAPDGTLGGSPTSADGGFNEFRVEVSDGNTTAATTLRIRVFDPSRNPTTDLFGWWPLNEGSGEVAADISGGGRDAAIIRVETGGLGAGGAAWIEDPECGAVLSFNGNDGSGSYGIMTDGNPGVYGELPLFTTDPDNDFTWSVWVKAEDNAANNDIILGNRYQPGGGEFAPRQFIKFDSNNFEYDTNNVQGVDYADIVGDQLGRWVHHVIVKDGADFTYYRDGVQAGTGTAGGDQTTPLPLFFGGQGDFAGGNNAELWRGALFDVRLFTRAISEEEVTGLFINKGLFTMAAGPRIFFDVARSGDDLVLTWSSQGGKLYNLRSETDLSVAPPAEWPIFDGQADLEATPPENTLTIAGPADPERFFVIEEFNAPPVVVLSDDFENGPGDWTVGTGGAAGTAWELGVPSNVGPLDANSPDNCFGTNIADDYAIDANVWLRSPAIDLTTAGGATLRFAQFRDIEQGFDFGSIRVLDAADNSELAVIDDVIDGVTADWEQVTKSMPDEVLGKTVRIEFRFQADDIQTFAGWYLDDVEVTVP